jgi:hypothetical protein
MDVEFGYYPEFVDLQGQCFRIVTNSELPSKIVAVNSDDGVEENWIYAPQQSSVNFFSGAISRKPYSARVFGLPKTHTLIHQGNDRLRCRFLIWSFGFLVGMRMSDQDAGFLDGTPIKAGVSNDIVWAADSVIVALNAVDDLYVSSANVSRFHKTVLGAIHSFLLSDLPLLLDYERFLHLYSVFEACFAATRAMEGKVKGFVNHAARIAYVCSKFGIPVPTWADPRASVVANQRNSTIHEALFFDEPWGFSVFETVNSQSGMSLLEMQKLACRVIIGLLGIKASDYLGSSISDRQRHGIHLK